MVQNHLFQILCNLAMEPPVRNDSESIRDEKVKVLKAIPPCRRTTWSAASSAAIARKREWLPIRTSRPLPPCDWRSIPGAGKACPSTSAPARICR